MTGYNTRWSTMSIEEEPPDTTVYIRISLPEHKLQRCLQFQLNETIFEAKQRILAFFGKELKDGLNYGLYCPPLNGRAGKFLDEERPLRDYPLPGPIGFLEFKYKRRVYKTMQFNPHKIKKQHTKANLKQFIEAVKHGSASKVTKFTSKGLDPNFHEAELGESPMTLATSLSKSRDVILALVGGGAHLDFRNKRSLTPMHKAAMTGNYEAIKTLLELGASPNYRDSCGLTPLYYCVCNEVSPNCVELLLHERSVVGVQDEQGWAEIHQACRYGRVQHLEHLLFYGAEMNQRNASGNTPLHVCAVNNQESCGRVLLFRGADKMLENFSSQTPFQVAIIANNVEMAEVIKAHSSDEVVPFKEPPNYTDRRRSSITPLQTQLVRSRSDPRLNLSHLQDCFDDYDGSTLTNSMISSPSSSTLNDVSRSNSYRYPERGHMNGLPQRSMSVCSSISGRSDDSSIYAFPKRRLYAALPGRTFVCIRSYKPTQAGELELNKGQFVEVLSVGEEGFWEGKVGHGEGWFPSENVQEVIMRKKVGRTNDDSVVLKRNTLAALVNTESENTTICVVLQRGKIGYGFVLRGARSNQSSTSTLDFIPSPDFPALQYLDNVEKNGMADKAGLKKGDFVLEINGENVIRATHEHAVKLIKMSKDSLAMKVVRVKSPHDGVWTVEHIDQSGLARKKGSQQATRAVSFRIVRTPQPPKRDPRTSLSIGRSRAKSMIDGLAQLEQTLAHYDSDGVSLRSNNSYDSLNNGDKPTTASIRSRPSSQKISNQQLDDLFARQGSSEQILPSQMKLNMEKPMIAVPLQKYYSPAQLRAQKYKHKRKAANSLGVSQSLSTPNLDYVDEVGDDSDSTISSLSTDKGIVINAMANMNGRRVSMDSQLSASSQLSDGVLIPPPPNYPPPLPPKQDSKPDVVKIQPNGVTYANISEQLQRSGEIPPVESSFRPGKLAQLHTPKTVTKDQVIVHHRNNSLDKQRAHQAQLQLVDHSRTASLPDHTRIVSGNVHQMAARFEQQSSPPPNPYQSGTAHGVQSSETQVVGQDGMMAKGVTFADDRVFENAARFMEAYPNATMLVTAEMANNSAANSRHASGQDSPDSYFTPTPDYDEPSPDYNETKGMDLDQLQKLVSENKAITDSWAKASGVQSSSNSSNKSQTPSSPNSNLNIPQQFQNDHQVPPPPTVPPPSVPVVKQKKPPTPPPPTRTTAVLQRKVSSESTTSKQSLDVKETIVIPKPPAFKPPSPKPSTNSKVESIPPPAPPPPPQDTVVNTHQVNPKMGMGAVKLKHGNPQNNKEETHVAGKPISNSVLQNALQSAVQKRQLRNVDTEAQISKTKETKPNHENDLLAAVAKRQERMKDTSGSMVVRKMEKSIEERKKQNATTAVDPAAALAAAVAKRRSLIESGATNDLHDQIEKNVAKTKKMSSTRYGKTVDDKPQEKKSPPQTSGKLVLEKEKKTSSVKDDHKAKTVVKTTTANTKTESLGNSNKKVPPVVPTKVSHSNSAIQPQKDTLIEKLSVKSSDNKKSQNESTRKLSEPKVGKDENSNKNVKTDNSIDSKNGSGFTKKASEKLEWLKQRKLTKTSSDKSSDSEKEKSPTPEKEVSPTLQKQLSVDIGGVTTDQSSTDVSSVQGSVDELSNMLNSVNNKISQLSPNTDSKMNGNSKKDLPNGKNVKPVTNGMTIEQSSDILSKTNGRQSTPPKLKNIPVAIPPPLGLFDDPLMVETNIDDGVDGLPPPPPEFIMNGFDEGSSPGSHRVSTDALPPPPPTAFSHNASPRGASEDAVSLISTTSTLSTLSSDNGGVDHSGHLLPLHEYSSMNVQYYGENYEPLAQLPPPPPLEFGDDDPSVSSGYGSVIMGDAEHLYEELGGREVVPPPPSFEAPDAPSNSSSLKTVIHITMTDDEEQSDEQSKLNPLTFRNKPIYKWSCDDVGDWLESLKLSEYRDCFVENMIDGENLSKLTRDEYFELGVTRIGHRMNMERAIKQLNGVRL